MLGVSAVDELENKVFAEEPSPLSPVLVPADRGPLWLLLGLLDEGEELHAGVVQVLVHQNAIKKVPIFGLHQLRGLLQLHKVVLLQVENMKVPF